MATFRPIIRTSDRNQFRRCRQKWDFGSKIRQGYEFVPGIEPLDFGIAIHSGAEVYYDPDRWNDPRALVQYEATLAFIEHLEEWKKRLQSVDMWDAQRSRWEELMELGIGMLEHYYLWAPKHDTDLLPIKSEIEFEISIPVPESVRYTVNMLDRFRVGEEGQLQYKIETPLGGPDSLVRVEWVDVLYQGRIDLLAQIISTGKYAIVDHKSAAQFGQTEHLDLDTQCGSYKWALKRILNLDIDTVVYSEWRKAIPKPPKVLKSGYLSRNKAQATTVEMYVAEIERLGHDMAWYADFLPKLKENQTEYFRRNEVHRSDFELAAIERSICMEAIDMLNDPFIYPNPDRWNCNGCAFRTPCLMRQDGSDVDWHLNHSGFYVKINQQDEENQDD